jgi:four helix bundle protein
MTEKEIFINQMKDRTKRLALEIIAFCNSLPRNRTCFRIGDQFLRSGTSVGANYRAACRSRSKAEFNEITSILAKARKSLSNR